MAGAAAGMSAEVVREKEKKINELIEELGNKEMLLSEAQAELSSVRRGGHFCCWPRPHCFTLQLRCPPAAGCPPAASMPTCSCDACGWNCSGAACVSLLPLPRLLWRTDPP